MSQSKKKKKRGSATVEAVVNEAHTQAQGMRDLGPEVTQGAPFSDTQIDDQANKVSTLRQTQQNAKAAEHTAMESLKVQQKTLREMFSRNVSFFEGKLGKTDPRLPKVGGKVKVHKGGRRAKKAAPPGTVPPPAPPAKT